MVLCFWPMGQFLPRRNVFVRHRPGGAPINFVVRERIERAKNACAPRWPCPGRCGGVRPLFQKRKPNPSLSFLHGLFPQKCCDRPLPPPPPPHRIYRVTSFFLVLDSSVTASGRVIAVPTLFFGPGANVSSKRAFVNGIFGLRPSKIREFCNPKLRTRR